MTRLSHPDHETDGSPWTVAVFAARERADELLATITSLQQAASLPTLVDVMVNGNPALADEIAELVDKAPPSDTCASIRIWSIPLAGKAHAWNQYVHGIWPGSDLAYFIDGYARIRPDGLRLLAVALAERPDALAAGGLPRLGRTANALRESMLREGGLHGSLFTIKANVINEFRQRGFRLPLGLYGFDSLLGAVLAFALDPAKSHWDAKRYIYLHPDVPFFVDQKKWWRYSVLKTHFKRTLNNALRVLVVEATKNFLAQRKRPPEQLPRTVEEFVLGWVAECPEQARATLRRSPLCRLALNKLRQPRDWSAAQEAPRLVLSARR